MANGPINRRAVLGGVVGAAGLAALPAFAQDGSTEFTQPASASVRNNISSFRMLRWEDYFDNTRNGAILADTTSRALHYWSEDQSIYRLYPTSVPLSEELTRRGFTTDVQIAGWTRGEAKPGCLGHSSVIVVTAYPAEVPFRSAGFGTVGFNLAASSKRPERRVP